MTAKRTVPLSIMLIVGITLLVAVVPLLIYVFWFAGHEFTENPSDFGVFGDFVGGVTNVILGIINIWLVAYIAVKLGRREEDSEAKKHLYMLLREWNGDEMYRCRTEAWELVRQNPTTTIKEFSDDNRQESRCLWVVIGFFRDLQTAVEQGIVFKNDAIDAFGQIFTWWDTVALRGDYPKAWDAEQKWHTLKKSIASRKGDQLSIWVANASKELDGCLPPPAGESE
ncbi:MAG: hypothetical protein AAF483_04370 [Planctomycetota bacterium]